MSAKAEHADPKHLSPQWSLTRVLSGSGRAFTVKKLAEQLSRSKSTIEQDIATLEKVFRLVEEAQGKQKAYKIAQRKDPRT